MGDTVYYVPKSRAYPEEVRQQAIKTYYSGVSGRGVGALLHMSKSNVYREGVNADLRHNIPILTRRSRCFARTLETLQAVVEVFVEAYTRFGVAEHNYRQRRKSGEFPFALVDYL